jgi:hypothetical protein
MVSPRDISSRSARLNARLPRLRSASPFEARSLGLPDVLRVADFRPVASPRCGFRSPDAGMCSPGSDPARRQYVRGLQIMPRQSGSLAARQQGDGGWNKLGTFDDWARVRLAGQGNLTLEDLVREQRGDRVLIWLLHQAHFDGKGGLLTFSAARTKVCTADKGTKPLSQN